MKNSKRIIFRILLLASIAILMVLLCGCRTRLSNNSDVHSRIQDDGYLSENYEYRRDDLGLSIAEKPLINPDTGEDEEDEYDDEFDYEPSQTDDYEDDTTTDDTDKDDSEDDDDSSTTTTRPSSGTTRRSTTGTRRPSTSTTTTAVKVTLNANGGECKKKSIYVRKGSTYGTLPEATRDGYKQTGWFTKKEGGNKVTSKTKVNTSSAHTLYAQWEVQTKKTYKVAFNANDDDKDKAELSGDSITVEEDGTYGELPDAKRVGYFFDGWYTEKEDGKGNKIVKGDKFTANADQTLYARWNDDHSKWWDDEFKTTANDVVEDDADKVTCYLDTSDSGVQNMIEDCRGKIVENEDEAQYSIVLPDPKAVGEFEEIANAAYQAFMTQHADYKGAVIVISRDAFKNNSNENLVARIRMLNELYSAKSNLDADKAAQQLEIDKTLIYVFPAVAGE